MIIVWLLTSKSVYSKVLINIDLKTLFLNYELLTQFGLF